MDDVFLTIIAIIIMIMVVVFGIIGITYSANKNANKVGCDRLDRQASRCCNDCKISNLRYHRFQFESYARNVCLCKDNTNKVISLW